MANRLLLDYLREEQSVYRLCARGMVKLEGTLNYVECKEHFDGLLDVTDLEIFEERSAVAGDEALIMVEWACLLHWKWFETGRQVLTRLTILRRLMVMRGLSLMLGQASPSEKKRSRRKKF